MRSFRYLLLFLVLVIISNASRAETLDDCLINNLKGVTSDLAAETIKQVCERKFGSKVENQTGFIAAKPMTGKITLELKKSLIGFANQDKTPVYSISVPEGNWKKIGETKSYKVSPPMHTEVWVNVIDGKIHNVFFAEYNKASNSNGWNRSTLCLRKNLHFIEVTENKAGGKQNCRLVNHIRLTGGDNKNKAVKQAKQWAADNQLPFPSTVIVHQHMFAHKKYLNFWVGYNPEIEGFPPPTDAAWDSNDWHQDKIIGDQERQQFVSKVKSAGDMIHPNLEEQFFPKERKLF